MNRNDKARKYRDLPLGILGVFILVIFILLFVLAPKTTRGFHIEETSRMRNEFTVSWGSQKQTMTLPGSIKNPEKEVITMTTTLPEKTEYSVNSILVYSRQSRIKIYQAGEMIYDSGEAATTPYPLAYGSFWNSVRLKPGWQGEELKIEIQPMFAQSAVSGYLPAVYLGSESSFLYMVLENGALAAGQSLLLILLGLYFAFMGAFFEHQKKTDSLCFLGFFAIDVGAWMLLESHVLQLFMSRLAVYSFFEYITYDLMPIFIVRFLLSYEEFREKKYMKLLYYSGIAIVLALLLAAITGHGYLFRTQIAVQIYIMVSLVCFIIALISLRKGKKRFQDRRLIHGIWILIVSTICEFIQFFLINRGESGVILRMGLLIFIGYLGITLMQEGRKLRAGDYETAALAAMAYKDGLTGMANRAAYEADKTKLEGQQNTAVIVMVADMNGLKFINDQYGHASGDQAICTVGKMMQQAFDQIGKSYRIGGDEFCVLAEGIEMEQFEKVCQSFLRNMEQIQSEYPIEVAIGVEHGVSKNMDDIFKSADATMYQCKMKMKEERNHTGRNRQ